VWCCWLWGDAGCLIVWLELGLGLVVGWCLVLAVDSGPWCDSIQSALPFPGRVLKYLTMLVTLLRGCLSADCVSWL
jgi:hypothetical protein